MWCRRTRAPEAWAPPADAMLNALAHRGPDDGGFTAGPNGFLGNRRLSIFDLSTAGHQPFFSDDGRIWLVFNGEIYNHYEIRKELERAFSFRSHSDTEVLLRAYEQWGMACLEKFVGMFAFAIWDGRRQELILCRDRIGIKPLYYHDDGDTLSFASEIKALLAAGVRAAADLDSLRDYLVLGLYDHTDRTFFDGIRQVPQGCYLTLSSAGVRTTRYWDLADRVRNHPLPANEALEAYWATLEDSVQLRMRADVPYAVMLSGGLDSSTMAVLADRYVRSRPLNVMTFRHREARYDEGPWADLVAKGRHWLSRSVVVTEEHVVEHFDRLLWHQDEPFGGVAGFADSFLAEMARDEGTYVLLEGQGADETLGGYEYYYFHYIADLADSEPSTAEGLYRQYALRRGVLERDLAEQYAGFLAKARARAANLAQDGTAATQPHVVARDLIARGGTGFRENRISPLQFTNALYRDLTATKVPRVLRFKDKSSMAHGVELRVPFLDHRLVELSFSIPASQKIADGFTKACLRRRMAGLLPEETCFHVKRQVQTPQREWMRGALRPMVDETIRSKSFADRGWVDADAARRLYEEYNNEPDKYSNSFFIWQWLSLERWARMFLDGAHYRTYLSAPARPNVQRMPTGAPKNTSCRTA